MDDLIIEGAIGQVDSEIIVVINKTKNEEYKMLFNATDRQKKMIKAGGLLNLVKDK